VRRSSTTPRRSSRAEPRCTQRVYRKRSLLERQLKAVCWSFVLRANCHAECSQAYTEASRNFGAKQHDARKQRYNLGNYTPCLEKDPGILRCNSRNCCCRPILTFFCRKFAVILQRKYCRQLKDGRGLCFYTLPTSLIAALPGKTGSMKLRLSLFNVSCY